MGSSQLSEAAIQALRLILQHVAEELYPDMHEAALPGAMLDCLSHPPKSTLEDRVARARLFTFRKTAERTLQAYEAARAG